MSVQIARLAAPVPAADARSPYLGIDLTTGDLAGLASAVAALIADAPPAVTETVAAVPDEWLAPGITGATRREKARTLLADEGKLPLTAIVGRSHAIVAGQFRDQFATPAANWTPGASGAVLVCDFAGAAAADGAMLVSLSRCEIGPGSIRMRGRHAMRVPRAGTCGQSLLALARDRTGGAPPAPGAPELARREAVRLLYRELATRRQRLRIALAAARGNPAYRDTPVAGLPGSPAAQWVTAGEAESHFAPLAATLTGLVAAVHADAPLPAGASLVLTGEEADNPLARDLLCEEIERLAVGGPGQVVVMPDPPVADGAALIASGAVAVDLPMSADVRLPLHKITGGQLRAETLPAPAFRHCGALPVSRDGAPVTVTVRGPQDGAIWMEIVRPDGRATTEVIHGQAPVRPGSYQVGLWPDSEGGAVVVLRPASAGQPGLPALAAGGDGAVPVFFELPLRGRPAAASTAG